VPTLQPTSNGHHTNGHTEMPSGSVAPDLAAFRAYMERERPALIATLMREMMATIPPFREHSPELHAEITSRTVGAYIAALDHPEHMADWAERGLRPVVEQGMDLDSLLAIIALYQQELLDLSLRAIEEGVPGVANGLRALMRASDTSTRVVMQIFQERMRLFQTLAENAPDAILIATTAGVIRYANPALYTLLGYHEHAPGANILDHLAAAPEQLAEINERMQSSGVWSGQMDYRRRDGSTVQCHASSFLIRMSAGDPGVIASIVRDQTEKLRAEQERLALQEQVIQAQQAALRELSTPLIPLADGIVAMPLIGTIDSRRAQQVVDELLQGVAGNRATTAIIDITGVPVVDTQVAGALLRAAQAVELLGARVILTGIRPEVAQTLVGIGVNLGSMITRSTLQDGIAYALRRR
jgi:PAS domain S-box-containing protein